MKYLIDTHIFLWLLFEPKKIDKAKLEILEDRKNKIFISNITFWEISIKYNLNKLKLNGVLPEDLPKFAKKMGLEIINIDSNTMASFYNLPKTEKHKDPFDRLLIWSCINSDTILVSCDSSLKYYKEFGLKYI